MDGDQTIINNSSDQLTTLLLLSGQNSPPLEQFFSQVLQKSSKEHFLCISCIKATDRRHGSTVVCLSFCCCCCLLQRSSGFQAENVSHSFGSVDFPSRRRHVATAGLLTCTSRKSFFLCASNFQHTSGHVDHYCLHQSDSGTAAGCVITLYLRKYGNTEGNYTFLQNGCINM